MTENSQEGTSLLDENSQEGTSLLSEMTMKRLSDRRKDLIYLITYIGYMSIYMNRITLSMAGPDMKAAEILTTAQLGFLGTAFSTVYAVGRLLNSMLADSVEPRTMIGIGLLVTGTSGVFVGVLPPFPAILLLWCVNAFAQSMLWSSVLRIISAVYTDSRVRATRLSIVASTVAAGQLIGILVSMFVLDKLGLRWAFILPGLFTFVMALTVFLTYPTVDETKAKQKIEIGATIRHMADTVKIPEVRLAVLPAVFMGLMKDNATLWMAVYFVDTYAIDLNETTGFVLFVPLVGLAARLLVPVCLKLAKYNEHLVSMYAFAGSLVASVLLVTVKNPVIAVISLSVVYGGMSMVNTAMQSIFPSRYADRGFIAAISGVLDLVAYLGAAVGSSVFGLTIDAWGYGVMFASWAFMSTAGWLITGKLFRLQEKTEKAG